MSCRARLGLTGLNLRFCDMVKVKGDERPDECFHEMLLLNNLLAKAKGTKRTDAKMLPLL